MAIALIMFCPVIVAVVKPGTTLHYYYF